MGDSGLLRAAARRVDGFDEERVFPLATHLDRPERARALYLLTLALGDLEPWDSVTASTSCSRSCSTCSSSPTLTGLEARNLVERRRAEAVRLVQTATAACRAASTHAPRAYLLAQDAADIARQAAAARAAARPRTRHGSRVYSLDDGRSGEVEVASRDRPGSAREVSGCSPTTGSTSSTRSWRPGATAARSSASSSRRAAGRRSRRRSSELPARPTRGAASAIVGAFDRPLDGAAESRRRGRFDDAGSPWYTLCEVRSPDRRGLLHTITAAIASRRRDVHSARLATVGGQAVDRFELTDRNGRKLDRRGRQDEPLRAGCDRPPGRLQRRRLRPRGGSPWSAARPSVGDAGPVRVGVDTGGTFTDLVADDGRIVKVPSTPDDPGDAVRARRRRSRRGDGPSCSRHGTTVATNALLERTGGAGRARHDPRLRRRDRDRAPGPARRSTTRASTGRRPLVAAGRCGSRSAAGSTRHGSRDRAARPLDASPAVPDGVDAVAVCLLHADLDAAHEQRGRRRSSRTRGLDVTCSHEVSPEFREYERTVTTVANAAPAAGVPDVPARARPLAARCW